MHEIFTRPDVLELEAFLFKKISEHNPPFKSHIQIAFWLDATVPSHFADLMEDMEQEAGFEECNQWLGKLMVRTGKYASSTGDFSTVHPIEKSA